jgi:hypothetical protein
MDLSGNEGKITAGWFTFQLIKTLTTEVTEKTIHDEGY